MPRSVRRPSPTLVAAAFAIVYVLWGSTYLAIRFAVETLPPFLLAGVRFLIAGSLLTAWTLLRGAKRPTLANWKAASIVGILLFPCANGIVVWSEQRIDSGHAALIVAIEPIWVVILLWLQSRTRPSIHVLAGTIAGFAGLVLLIGSGSHAQIGSIDLVAALALVAAACSWALGSLYARSAPLPSEPLLAAALEMLVGGVALIVVALARGEPHALHLAAVSNRSVLALAYLIVFGSLVGFSAYSWLVGVAPPARVATYAYVNPVIAVLLGWALAGETLSVRVVIAAAVIVGSVALVTMDPATSASKDVQSVTDAESVRSL